MFSFQQCSLTHSVKNDRQGFFMLGLSATVCATSKLFYALYSLISIHSLLLEMLSDTNLRVREAFPSCQLNNSFRLFTQKGAKNDL